MRNTTQALRGGFLAALLVCVGVSSPARGQTVTRDDIIKQLNHFESPPSLDLPALRTQTQERSKIRSRTEPPPAKRQPIVPELMSLQGLNVDIQFDTDTPIVRPDSYQTVGRIADAMVHGSLLPYSFLIVGHIEANGKRESNVALSQRRADAIRDILANTFKISVKRMQAIGLGEEQILDPTRPTASVNQQIQIFTIAKTVEEPAPVAAAPSAPPPAALPKRRK
jgi:outer membrane protein OmpA-like peptidoglycan-associated protein